MGNPQGNPLKRIVREVHRRSLWQVLAIYVAAGWVVFEVVQTLTEGLGLPGWFPSFAFVLLLIGLPVVLATAFVQEGGPAGAGSEAPLIDATGREIEGRKPSSASAGPARRLFTWRNAMLGGMAALALWGVLATGWIVFGDRPPRDRGDGGAGRPSLAVLPFDNLSPDPDNAYFAAGIHEEMLTQLSRIDGIDLISRTSVLQYEDTEKSLTEIADELGVATIMEGSVQWAGDNVRITVQLNDALEDRHIWAERYDRELSDIFRIQTDVATRVVEELKGVLTPEEQTELTLRPTDDLEAYAHYLRGQAHFRTLFSEEETRAAAEAYQRAVELDPDFAAAWARLVQTRLWLMWIWGQPEERPRARAALERLEAIAPGSPELRYARGIWLYWGVQRYEEAVREFEVLAELWPGDVYVLLYKGALYRRLGRWEEGVQVWERALELDPANGSTAQSIGEAYTAMRRFEEGERYAKLAVSLSPGVPVHWWTLASTRIARGDRSAARSAVDSAGRHLDDERLQSGGWWALWQVYEGRVGEVLDLYRELYRDPTSWDGTWARSWDLGLAGAAAGGMSVVVEDLADTLRAGVERALPSVPMEFVVARSRMLSQLALAHAYLGNDETAVGLAREAVELLPVSRDASWGSGHVRTEAHVHAVVGRPDDAVERLRYLLSIPSGVTVPLLRIDPRWDPLREQPGFQALLEEGGSG